MGDKSETDDWWKMDRVMTSLYEKNFFKSMGSFSRPWGRCIPTISIIYTWSTATYKHH